MTRMIFFICVIIYLSSCSILKNNEEDKPYHVLTSVREITPDMLGNKNAYSVAMSGDTVFVVAFDSSNTAALFLIFHSSGKVLAEVNTWDSGATTFSGHPTCVAVDSQYIFVGDVDSRVDVFKRKTLAHYTTVGTGVWWSADNRVMVHSFGLLSIDDRLFVRDKSNIRVFPHDYIRPETEWNVPLYSKSIALPTNTVHYNIVEYNDKIAVRAKSHIYPRFPHIRAVID